MFLLGSPLVLSSGVRVVHSVMLCFFTFLVLYCDVCYYVRIETMFDTSSPPVVCRRVHVLFMLCVRSRIVVSYTPWIYGLHGGCFIKDSNCLPPDGVCVVHLFSFMCVFCLFVRPVSCMCNVTTVPGLSIIDCPFGFL